MSHENLDQILLACSLRRALVRENPDSAYRLFSGFREGEPHLVIDRYRHTLVMYDHSLETTFDQTFFESLIEKLKQIFPELRLVILKVRNSDQAELRNGILLHGDPPDRWIREHGIRYSIDLQLNQDASFYLDTRHLRQWLMDNALEKTVLNTFAYTGSLGTAAMAGNASQVIQTDLNRNFLNVAKTSYSLNGFPVEKQNFISGDFYKVIARLKNTKQLFDLVILDPPFFSDTAAGRVDIVHQYKRLINKVRPLVGHEGKLIAVNNAVFLSGQAYMAILEDLCQSKYLSLDSLIPVPEDCIGFPQSIITPPLVDPAPFNHSTKIAVLHITRKDQRTP